MKNINKKISTKLKKIRKERGWSLDTASLETGVSKSMLGQIEREESSPTIATLWKIATGFQTSFSSFLDAPENKATIKRPGILKTIDPHDSGVRVSTLFPYNPATQFEVFIIELAPGCEHLSSPHDQGVTEHIMTTEGTMEILADGKWHKIKQGEGFKFNADQPHGYRNKTQQKAIIIDIIHYSAAR